MGLRKNTYGTIVSKEGELQKVHPESNLILPYLPDPLSSGASFLGLPGQVKGLLGLSGAPDPTISKRLVYSEIFEL